jgi:hypothetical protein
MSDNCLTMYTTISFSRMFLLPSISWFRYNANEISKQFRETCLVVVVVMVVVVVFLSCHKLALGQGWYYWRN